MSRGGMIIYPVFQRIPSATDESISTHDLSKEWQARMDQLLLSDPVEILAFCVDALISVAARAKDDVETEEAYEASLNALDLAGIGSRGEIMEMVRGRARDILAILAEQLPGEITVGQMMAGIYKIQREEPWPWPKEQQSMPTKSTSQESAKGTRWQRTKSKLSPSSRKGKQT